MDDHTYGILWYGLVEIGYNIMQQDGDSYIVSCIRMYYSDRMICSIIGLFSLRDYFCIKYVLYK